MRDIDLISAAACPRHDGFDPFDPSYLGDPYPVFAGLREASAVHYAASIDMYLVTRYEDIDAVFRDPQTFSAAIAQDPITPLTGRAAELFERYVNVERTQSNCDPPKHNRIRSHTGRAFSPRQMRRLEPIIRQRAEELIGAFLPQRRAEIVTQLAFPLTATTIFTLIGFPPKDTDVLRQWATDRLSVIWGHPAEGEQIEVVEKMAAYWRYCQEFVGLRLVEPSDDFTSDLLTAHREDPESITPAEVASIVFGLSFAGHETTTNILASGIRRLLERPERWRHLRDNPELADNAVEETLRFDTSVIAWRRVTTRPAVIGGVLVPSGAKLLLLLGSANRDGSQFTDPDEFDLNRIEARNHLSFGRGIHYCLGAALARLQTRVVYEILPACIPGLQMEAQEITFHPNIAFRGPRTLWVEWDATP